MMNAKKRIISACLGLSMLLSPSMQVHADAVMQHTATDDDDTAVVSQEFFAPEESKSYNGTLLAAINTQLSSSSKENGYFASEGEGPQLSEVEAEDAGIVNVYTDPDTGDTFFEREPRFPENPEDFHGFIRDDDDTEIDNPDHREGSAYEVGSTKILRWVDDNSYIHKNSMRCLYVGQHCTVWGSAQDAAAISISASQAAQIGQQFDSQFPAETNAFGDYWYDADQDDKVAIMCYDIDADYGYSVSTYTAGYFFNMDMVDTSGYIKSAYYGSNAYLNGIDCIHIDTYPGMGTKLNNIERCYSTLTHEFQHMLNFSYRVKGDRFISTSMETYLNEAFSMAAEHMVCGASSTANRISYFNGSSYMKGSPLTYWGSTLSNYSNSYLFGQYIRTRYAQTGNDGNTIFKKVMESRSDSNSDTLGIIAGMLDTDKEQLVLDFWTAVALKKSSGRYGFNGEAWADSISVDNQTYSGFSSTSGIYNGGVKYYSLTSGFTPNNSTNITFVAMNADGPTSGAPQAKNVLVKRTGPKTAEFSFTPSQDGYLCYVTSEEPLTNSDLLDGEELISITANQPVLITIDNLQAADDQPWNISYYLMSKTAEAGNLCSVTIPAYRYAITFDCGAHGSLLVLDGETPITDGELVVSGTLLTVRAVPDDGYIVRSVRVDDNDFENNGILCADRAHHISASFIHGDVAPSDGFASGSGTEEDPYRISSTAEWKYFAQRVNNGDTMQGAYIVLSDDLDFEGITVTPVGMAKETPFAGVFDGNDHTLSNIAMADRDLQAVGVFGYVSGTVRGLNLSGSSFSFSAESSNTTAYVGAVAASLQAGGVVDDCFITDCSVRLGSVGMAYLGGVVGSNSGMISNCISEASVTSTDEEVNNVRVYIGGIAGYSSGTIQTCYHADAPSVTCANGGATVYIGGVCGYHRGEIVNCASNGVTSSGTAKTYTGGISGYSSGSIVGAVCSETPVSSASSSAASYTGGIVGYQKSGTIQNVLTAAESVTAASGNVGRIAGGADGTIENGYYNGNMSCTGNSTEGESAIWEEIRYEPWVTETLKLDIDSIWEVAVCPTTSVPTLQLYRYKVGVPITLLPCEANVSIISPAFIGMYVWVDMDDEDYIIDAVTVDGTPIEGQGFVVTEPHTVSVQVEKACHITVVQPENGRIYVSKTKAKKGDTVTVSASVNDGSFYTILLDGVKLSAGSFVVTGDHVISLDFPEILHSGTCGTKANWALTGDGTLYIYGSGTMQDYTSNISVPWYSYRSEITSCVVEYGVTSIGDRAFYNYDSLTSVTIPEGVTSIGDYAFYGCSALTSITIPGSVTSIGDDAFCYCSNMKDVFYIGTQAQWDKIRIGGNNWCLLTGATRHYMASADDVCTITVVPAAHGEVTVDRTVVAKGSTVTVTATPEGGYQLGALMVDGKEITGNTFTVTGNHILTAEFRKPYDTERMGACGTNAFWALTADGVLHIYGSGPMQDYTASSSAPWYSYRNEITSCAVEDGMTSIGNYAFYGCSKLTGITIPDSVTSIGNYAFYGCSKLTIITIPEGVTSISGRAFYNCSALTSITIPGSVTSIIYEAFYNCSNLKDVFYIGTQAQWDNISIGSDNTPLTNATLHYVASSDDVGTLTVVPAEHGTIIIRSQAAKGETVSVTANPKVGYKADVILVDGTEITGNTFTVTGNHTVTAVFSKAYDAQWSGKCGDAVSWALTDDGVLHIFGLGQMADYTSSSSAPWYSHTSEITSCEMEDGVTSISGRAFYNCSALTSITIPDGVTSIGSYAFNGCSKLTSVTIPEGVTSIGDYAFYGCSALTSITIPDGVTSIGNYAFYGCSKLTGITIPEGVISIGISTFNGCSALTSVTIPEGVTSISRYTFHACSALTRITIPGSVTSIGDSAFFGCLNLVSVLYFGTEEQWNNISIGSDNPYLTSATRYYVASVDDLCTLTVVPAEHGDIIISNSQVAKDEMISVIANPETGYKADMILVDGKEITGNTFTVTGNHTVTAVFSKAYDAQWSGKCGDAVSWALTDDGVLHIFGLGQMTDYTPSKSMPWYSHTSEITSCEMEDGVTSIGGYAFCNCSALTSITIPDGVTSIGNYAFYGCSKLTSVIIPGSVTSIGICAFRYCRALTDITLHEGVASIGDSAFDSCSKLTSVIIPGSVTSIVRSTFIDCSALTSVTIQDGVTSIGNYAFNGCSKLTSITIPGSVTSIGDYAFRYCSNMKDVFYIGTQAQWDKISIGSSNTPLTDATRYYVSVAATVQTNGTQIDICVQSKTAGNVLVAFYDQQTGQLNCVRTFAMNIGMTNIAIDTAALGMEGYRAKVIMVNSDYIPVGIAAEIRK